MSELLLLSTGSVVPAGFDALGVAENELLRGCDDEALKRHIARRGIRYKDRATRLALASATLAMRRAGLPGSAPDPRCAVVAASCYGNVDTVIGTVRALREGSSADLSPMDLPNASPNVLAASLAIWFGLSGPNLFFAGGLAAGLDAVHFACNLLRAGRADRVLVCGAEVRQEAVDALFDPGVAPADGATSLVLASAARAGDATAATALALGSRLGGAIDAPAALHATDAAGVTTLHSLDALLPLHGAAGVAAFARAACLLRDGAAVSVRIGLGPDVRTSLTLWTPA